MYSFFSVLLLLVGLPMVFAVPFVLRLPVVQRSLMGMTRYLLQHVRRSPLRATFYPLLSAEVRRPTSQDLRRRSLIEGGVLCGAVLLTLAIASFPAEGSRMYATVRNTVFVGVVLGAIGLLLQRHIRGARTTGRCAVLMEKQGFSGVWLVNDSEDRAFEFRQPMIQALYQYKSVDAIACSGRCVLRLLSDPRAEMYKIPHPALKGAKVRMLLIPPRSQRVDPERQRCTSAESSLTRLERLPEQHWRDLQHVLEVRELWREQHGVDIEIRFVEDRPVFQALIVGRECWFRPWSAAGSAWMQVSQNGRQGQFHDMVRDSFVNTWSHSDTQVATGQMAAGPTGSQVIRKGVATSTRAPQRAPMNGDARTMGNPSTATFPSAPSIMPQTPESDHDVVTVTLSRAI